MIITKEEFTEMGFSFAPENEALVEGCIKRAEYMLGGICGGMLSSAALNEGSAALVKQAVAFQTDALLREETSAGTERVSLGDFSCTTAADKNAVGNISETVRKLLRAAGCLYGTRAAEVAE